MIKIGIIGTENSHALAFSKIINLPNERTGKYDYPDVKVVGVYGPDMVSAQAIIDEAKAEFIASSPEEFIGKVDAMIITSRKGSVHYKYALPFIELGMPVFIDKPFTVDQQEAKCIIAKAKEKGALISGGSGCKLAYDIIMLQNTVKSLVEKDKMVTGVINFSIDMDSENDGFFFYASHLTEMALASFGNDVKSVVALEKNKSVIAILRYDAYDITLNFINGSGEYTAVLFAKERNYTRNIDISFIYEHEVEHFINMIKTKEMPQSYEDLIVPVKVMNAIVKSYQEGKEIYIED